MTEAKKGLQGRVRATFFLTQEEIRKLVRFFDGLAKQPAVYQKPALVPLSKAEREAAEVIFNEIDCTSCHVVTGQPMTTETKAPNLTLANERLRPEWIRQWIEKPDAMVPGTGMSAFFECRTVRNWIG